MLRSLRPLEQQRRAAGPDRAVDDLRHLEVRIDLGRDADELALALEERDPLAQVAGGRHRSASAQLVGLAPALRRAARRWPAQFVSSPSAITAQEDQADDQHRR